MFDLKHRVGMQQPTRGKYRSYAVEALQTPFLALYRGAATVASRSWVFAELLRQANLNPVLLAVVDDGPEQRVRYALVAVLLPRATDVKQSDLYLFDAQLGLPLNNEQDQPLTLAELVKQTLTVTTLGCR